MYNYAEYSMVIVQQGKSIRSRIRKVLGFGQTLKCSRIGKTLREASLLEREKHEWKQGGLNANGTLGSSLETGLTEENLCWGKITAMGLISGMPWKP